MQKIKQANIFGRVGSGLAQGMGLQLPKEIEHYRMTKGLQDLEGQDLDPQQYFTRALSASPGMVDRPQVVQSLADLARQQMRGQALIQQQNQEPAPNPFPSPPQEASPSTNAPSVTKGETLEQIQKGFIPLNYDQLLQNAGKMYGANPKLYGGDPNNALRAAEDAEIRRKSIYDAQKQKHSDLQTIQDNIVNRLKNHSERLGVDPAVPANLYSKIEDKAINAVRPKAEGGEGLSEQEAMKKYGQQLDAASRDYKSLDSIGDWGITARPAAETLRTFKNLQKNAEDRGDTENLADEMISKNKVSPKFAYSAAEPVSRVPVANKFIKDLPSLKSIVNTSTTPGQVPSNISAPKTMEIAPKLAKMVKENPKLSPLAVAYELEKKGYHPDVWLKYLTDNRKDLDITESQGRQLDKPSNLIDPWNDWWLGSWTGIQ